MTIPFIFIVEQSNDNTVLFSCIFEQSNGDILQMV